MTKQQTDGLMKTSIPVLPIRNTGRALQFYSERLGFRIVHCDSGYAVAARDQIEIHLWAATDETWKARDRSNPLISGSETFLAGTASCRINVTQIEALYNTYREAKLVHPNGHLSDKPYGLREFAVLDLDGNLITFFQKI